MKFSVTHLWAHLWVYLWALLAATSAQQIKYMEEGGTLSLKPDVSTVQKPITYIIWRKGSDWVVDWITPDDINYYGSYKTRIHLNIETLQLDIHHLTLADSGTFSLKTDKANVGTYPVQVIISPPTPQLRFKPTVCHQDQPCVVKCDVDTLHLGPVTFYWRRKDGEWRPDDKQVTLSRPEEPETITCKLATPLQHSESSLPRDNPLYVPPTSPLWIIGLIVFILIVAAVAAVVFILIKYYRNKNLDPTTEEAQPRKYYVEGGTLSLMPDISTVQKPVTVIRWKKNSDLVVERNAPDAMMYFGSYENRAHLNIETLQLDIYHLTLADSATFSVETEKGTVGTYPVQVVPQPMKYVVEGGTLSLKPDVSTVNKPITFIRWKKDSDLVVDWNAPDDMVYFRSYKNRTHLNIETLQLDVNHLTLADSGTFSVETDEATVRRYLVQVIPQPMKYIEEGGTLSLKSDVSTVHKTITFIRWKKDSDWVVDWNAPDDMTYFGSYKNRAHLNIETLQLDIHHLTLADSGTFSLKTDEGTVGTYQVQVITGNKNSDPTTEEGGAAPPPAEAETKVDKPPSNGVSTEETSLLPPPAAQPRKYITECRTLSLKPDVSTVHKTITFIRWKKGSDLVVERNAPDDMVYYGSYKNRTHLNIETLQLDIHHLTLADSGTFSLVTDKGTVRRYPVQVVCAAVRTLSLHTGRREHLIDATDIQQVM